MIEFTNRKTIEKWAQKAQKAFSILKPQEKDNNVLLNSKNCNEWLKKKKKNKLFYQFCPLLKIGIEIANHISQMLPTNGHSKPQELRFIAGYR